LPEAGLYAVGVLFLPVDAAARASCERIVEEIAAREGQPVIGWRDVPTDDASLGATARAAQPVIRHVFLARDPAIADDLAFERKLYVIRRLVEKSVARSALAQRGMFYIPSLSHRTVVYKGMLNA